MRISSSSFFFMTLGVVVISLAACGDDEPGGAATSADAGSDAPQAQPEAGGGSDSAAPDAAATGLGPGPYTVVYAGSTVGIDMRTVAAGKATFDGVKLTGYEASEDEHPTAGTNEVKEVSGDAFVAIGRWAGGKTGGKFYEAGTGGLIDLPANGGFHYAIGNFADPVPASGQTAYTELAKTAATVSDGSLAAGTISGSLAANLTGDATKVGFSITIDIPGDAVYTLATTGGAGDVSTTEAEMLTGGNLKGVFTANLDVTSAGAACEGTCSGSVYGFVAGANAERIALVAHVYKGSGGSPKSVAGALVFKK